MQFELLIWKQGKVIPVTIFEEIEDYVASHPIDGDIGVIIDGHYKILTANLDDEWSLRDCSKEEAYINAIA